MKLTLALILFTSGCCGAVLHHRDRAYNPPAREVEEAALAGPTEVTPAADEPGAALAALEQRLLAAESVEFEVSIEAGAPYPARLIGRVRYNAKQEADIEVKGELSGEKAELFLQTGSGGAIGGNRASNKTFNLPATPPALNEAIVVGLLDMGILHNLAMLAQGTPPEKADGGVKTWVTTSNHSWDVSLDEDIGGRRGRALSFDVAVEGSDVADATLWLDRETGLPLKKRITVKFEAGTFTNVELYPRFDVVPRTTP